MDLTPQLSAPRRGVLPRLWWKRPVDVIVGGMALLIALPVIAMLALLVTLESSGPPFFHQERVGRRGMFFQMWKLRTMQSGCDDGLHRRAAANWFAGQATGDGYKSLADPRITRVGRVLRSLNLDELPQLLNVVWGDMSLVGPRPAIPYELAFYEPSYLERLQVPPGLTGLWQVTRRDRLSAAEMMRLDLQYVRDASLWLDLKILARTGPALLTEALRSD